MSDDDGGIKWGNVTLAGILIAAGAYGLVKLYKYFKASGKSDKEFIETYPEVKNYIIDRETTDSMESINIELSNYLKSLNLNRAIDYINIDHNIFSKSNDNDNNVISVYTNTFNISNTNISSKSTLIDNYDKYILRNILDRLENVYLGSFKKDTYVTYLTLDKLYRPIDIFPRLKNQSSYQDTYNIISDGVRDIIETYYKDLFEVAKKNDPSISNDTFKMNIVFKSDDDLSITSLDFYLLVDESNKSIKVNSLNSLLSYDLKKNILFKVVKLLHHSSQLWYNGLDIKFNKDTFNYNTLKNY